MYGITPDIIGGADMTDIAAVVGVPDLSIPAYRERIRQPHPRTDAGLMPDLYAATSTRTAPSRSIGPQALNADTPEGKLMAAISLKATTTSSRNADRREITD